MPDGFQTSPNGATPRQTGCALLASRAIQGRALRPGVSFIAQSAGLAALTAPVSWSPCFRIHQSQDRAAQCQRKGVWFRGCLVQVRSWHGSLFWFPPQVWRLSPCAAMAPRHRPAGVVRGTHYGEGLDVRWTPNCQTRSHRNLTETEGILDGNTELCDGLLPSESTRMAALCRSHR